MSYVAYGPRRWGRLAPSFDWHALTFNRLAWQYGPERAQKIMAGLDHATEADIDAWRSLGRRPCA